MEPGAAIKIPVEESFASTGEHAFSFKAAAQLWQFYRQILYPRGLTATASITSKGVVRDSLIANGVPVNDFTIPMIKFWNDLAKVDPKTLPTRAQVGDMFVPAVGKIPHTGDAPPPTVGRGGTRAPPEVTQFIESLPPGTDLTTVLAEEQAKFDKWQHLRLIPAPSVETVAAASAVTELTNRYEDTLELLHEYMEIIQNTVDQLPAKVSEIMPDLMRRAFDEQLPKCLAMAEAASRAVDEVRAYTERRAEMLRLADSGSRVAALRTAIARTASR